MAKKIGILTRVFDSTIGIGLPYITFASMYGEPVLVNYTEFRNDISLLILPGGPDVNPLRYSQVPSVYTQKSCPALEYFDEYIIPEYIRAEIPIFGICRGFQSLAILFGSELAQHIPQDYSKERDEKVHALRFANRFFELIRKENPKLFQGKTTYKVNSLHHQGLFNLSDDLEEVAVNSDDENIECFIHKKLRIAGVQYHPEELGYDILSNFLITNLLNNESSSLWDPKTRVREQQIIS